jgi:hypothetical protein
LIEVIREIRNLRATNNVQPMVSIKVKLLAKNKNLEILEQVLSLI